MMHYDLAIIGGGMVGGALACALQKTAAQVLLVDAAPPHAGQDHRLIALNNNSCALFKNLQLWPELAAHACAIQEIHVSKRGHFGATRLSAKEFGLAQLGHLVPAKEINRALLQQLTSLKNFTLKQQTKLIALAQNSDHVRLTIARDGEKEICTAKLVIGADGTHSTVRELLAIPAEQVDYQQKALVTQIELQRDHQHIAYERFLQTGAIAMLPLSERRVAVIWSDENAKIDALLKLSDTDFLQTAQEQFGFRLGKFLRAHARAFYPLHFVKAVEQIKGRVLLIGNAAHTVHPIAAQGLNLALYEIAVLAEKLALQTPAAFNMPDLAAYFAQQKISMNLSHRLSQIFSTDFFALNAARQFGLIGLDSLPIVKKRFIKRVTGRAGYVPDLCT